MKRVGWLHPGPRHSPASRPRKVRPRNVIELSVLHCNANLDRDVCAAAAPTPLLAFAHSTSDHAMDRRLDKARRNSPAFFLVSPVVDQRTDVGFEVLQRVG